MSDLCILIPTYDKYHWLAKFTHSVLNEYWEDHPEVYFCGSSLSRGGNWLALADDPADWNGIVKRACGELGGMGYSKLYLILDDHAPLARCHAPHLNKTIPDFMDRLGAAYIGLLGWGQGREATGGEILNKENHFIERVSEKYPWKFSLHPGLWNLTILQNLLAKLNEITGNDVETPWAFERKLGAPEADIDDSWKRSSYRINGMAMTKSIVNKYTRLIELFSCDVARFVAGRAFGVPARRRVEELTEFIYQYYEGPYPMIWRGVMTKGELNAEYIKYLKTHGKTYLQRKLKSAMEAPIK